jgi:tetrahydromethanopterin S-methyltransferase subunit F
LTKTTVKEIAMTVDPRTGEIIREQPRQQTQPRQQPRQPNQTQQSTITAAVAAQSSPLPRPNIDIFVAVQRNELATVRRWLLIDSNLVHSRDGDGNTPLHYAANLSDFRIFEYLISQRADPKVKNNRGIYPVYASKRPENISYLRNFIKKEFFNAVEQNNTALVKQWLEINPKLVNEKNDQGDFPIHIAASKYLEADMLYLLIYHHADLNAKNRNDKTPLEVANTVEKQRIIRTMPDRKHQLIVKNVGLVIGSAIFGVISGVICTLIGGIIGTIRYVSHYGISSDGIQKGFDNGCYNASFYGIIIGIIVCGILVSIVTLLPDDSDWKRLCHQWKS